MTDLSGHNSAKVDSYKTITNIPPYMGVMKKVFLEFLNIKTCKSVLLDSTLYIAF